MPDISFIAIFFIAFSLIGLFVVVKSFKLPDSFHDKEKKKKELKKYLPPEPPPE